MTASDSLQAAIKRLSPTARVLQANEIDMQECESVPKAPGVVKADFNGDGLEDAAVLLKVSVAKEVKIWEGKQYREAKLMFVIFLNDGKGGYTTLKRENYENLLPAMLFLDVIPPGKVRDIDTGKDVVLRNPGVMLTFCGKSAVAYRVIRSTVQEIPLSD